MDVVESFRYSAFGIRDSDDGGPFLLVMKKGRIPKAAKIAIYVRKQRRKMETIDCAAAECCILSVDDMEREKQSTGLVSRAEASIVPEPTSEFSGQQKKLRAVQRQRRTDDCYNES